MRDVGDGDGGAGAADAEDVTGATGGEAVDQEAQSQRGAEAGDRQDGVSRVSPRDAHAHDPDPEAGPELIPELVHHGPHRRPTAREIEEHNITHTPAKNWCSTCVAAKATDDPHRRRRPEDVDDGAQQEIAKIYFDYGFFSAIVLRRDRYRSLSPRANGPG